MGKCYYFHFLSLICIFQDFEREMSRGLKRAQAMQGGGDREGPIMVLDSEVGPTDL